MRTLTIIPLLLLSLLLASCASKQPLPQEPASMGATHITSRPEPTDGLVIMSISCSITNLHRPKLYLTLSRVHEVVDTAEEKMEKTKENDENDENDSIIFKTRCKDKPFLIIKRLPLGNYKLVSWKMDDTQNYAEQSLHRPLFITVSHEYITYLGRLLFSEKNHAYSASFVHHLLKDDEPVFRKRVPSLDETPIRSVT